MNKTTKMNRTLIRLPEVINRSGLARSTIYALMKQKENGFPKAIKLSSRAVAWLESDVDDWIESRIQEGKIGCKS